jgi:hypothetical protein
VEQGDQRDGWIDVPLLGSLQGVRLNPFPVRGEGARRQIIGHLGVDDRQ